MGTLFGVLGEMEDGIGFRGQQLLRTGTFLLPVLHQWYQALARIGSFHLLLGISETLGDLKKITQLQMASRELSSRPRFHGTLTPSLRIQEPLLHPFPPLPTTHRESRDPAQHRLPGSSLEWEK